jgi:uncharacterized repeat protein (TIGR03803 family)
MRNALIFFAAGVAFLFACSDAHSSVPQPSGITQSARQHSRINPANLPKHFHILYSFQDGVDGADPTGDLFRDGAGNLYGGAFGSQYRFGSVFKLEPNGNETVLHAFDYGYGFIGDLLEDSAGNLYGNTPGTGGVVFKIDAKGNYSVLHTFNGGTDGDSPNPGMVLDKVGNLYGVTIFGGSSGYGVVFKVEPNGNETVLYNLTTKSGEESHGGLIGDKAGNLYGTARIGGPNGLGTVFVIYCAANSALKCGNGAVLHSFDGQFHHPPPFRENDGNEPVARLAIDAGGSMYSTAYFGGLGDGVIFKIDPNGHERVLLALSNQGKFPTNDLAVDDAGNVYGTLGGLAFKVDSKGFFYTLYTFGGSDYPTGSLIRDAAGNLYGVSRGGPLGHGYVYELSP